MHCTCLLTHFTPPVSSPCQHGRSCSPPPFCQPHFTPPLCLPTSPLPRACAYCALKCVLTSAQQRLLRGSLPNKRHPKPRTHLHKQCSRGNIVRMCSHGAWWWLHYSCLMMQLTPPRRIRAHLQVLLSQGLSHAVVQLDHPASSCVNVCRNSVMLCDGASQGRYPW